MYKKSSLEFICVVAAFAAMATGCAKKKPAVATPPVTTPAPPEAPPPPNTGLRAAIAEFSVEPSTVERGQSAVLKWSVSNASSIAIDNGIGEVQSTGTRRITPTESTTYRLTANGPNGSVSGTATVNVTSPAPIAPTTTGKMSFDREVDTMVVDAYFDYDSNQIRPDAREALTKDADALKKIFADFPKATVIVEGHCDERGSAEYNLGLADQRASAAKEFLVSLGVPANRLKTVSYGKERPQCTDAAEECYQRNRRVHFAPSPQ